MLIDYDLKPDGPRTAGSPGFFDRHTPLYFRITFVLL
jgi:hypothetical protein